MWHDPRVLLCSFNVRLDFSWGVSGRSQSLSRQSRGIYPHIETRRGEGVRLSCARKLSVPLQWDQYVEELFELHQGCQVPFWISRRNVGFILTPCSRKGPHLEMIGEPRCFSQVAAGFSSYDGEIRESLVLPQGSPISIRGVRGSWWLLSGQCRANRPHLRLSQKWQNDLCSFPRQAIQYHSNPSLCPSWFCWRSWSWMFLWRPTRPSGTNTSKRCPFHYRGLECKSRKSRNTWSNRQIWPQSTEWSRAKANRILQR